MMSCRVLPILLLAIISAPLIHAADLLFDSWRVYPVGHDPRAACFADFDDDGDIDIAVACNESEEIFILLNTGDGTFHQAASYWVAEEAWAIETADLDRDGDMDLVVGVTHDVAAVAILKNNGNGTFMLPTYFGVPGRCFSVCIADFNGDEYLDIAAAIPEHRGAIILYNFGDGIFTDPYSPASAYNPRCVRASDLDGDGDLDLVVVDRGADYFSVLENIGNGKFDTPVIYSLDLDPSFATLADLNGDGSDDLIVNEERSESLYVYVNDGGGFFSASGQYYIGQYCLMFHAADIDNDGDNDIIACCMYRPFSLLFNDSQGLFSDAVTHPLNFWPAYVMDIGGDGNKELIGFYRRDRMAVLLTDNGQPPALPRYGGDYLFYDVTAADIDRDGHSDLLGSSMNSDSLIVLVNSGDGSYEDERFIALDASPELMVPADIDGDNDSDLLVETGWPNELAVLTNDGAGEFTHTGTIPLPGNLLSIIADDLDGDGDPDLAFHVHSGPEGDTIFILINTGTSGFELRIGLAEGLYYADICASDFDGDGGIDLALPCENGIAIAYNHGDASFEPSVSYPLDLWAGKLAAGDIDGDSDNDIIAAIDNVDSILLVCLTNDGGGIFHSDTIGSMAGTLLKLYLADLDADGDRDVAGACYTYGQGDMAVLINDNGSFRSAQYYGGSGRRIALIDLDNDDDIDAACATNNGISILFNLSDLATDADDLNDPGTRMTAWSLSQNYPNPFNPATRIEYTIPSRCRVTLIVFNVLGQQIITLVDRMQSAGSHSVLWDGTDGHGRSVSSGLYFYQLSFDDVVDTKKMMLLR